MKLYANEHGGEIPSLGNVSNFDSFWLWLGTPTYLGHLYDGGYVDTYKAFYCPGQEIKPDSFWDKFGEKLLREGDWKANPGILATYVQRTSAVDPKREGSHAIVACCRENDNLIPHGGTGKNVLYFDGSVRWLDGHTGNNFRWSAGETAEFWEEADEN